jgi:hypothetical protein
LFSLITVIFLAFIGGIDKLRGIPLRPLIKSLGAPNAQGARLCLAIRSGLFTWPDVVPGATKASPFAVTNAAGDCTGYDTRTVRSGVLPE